MHPIEHIRRNVLNMNQTAFAALAGAQQGTVSRWESGELQPDRGQMARIRAEVLERGLPWNDGWFFEAPVEPPKASSEATG